MLYLGIDTSYKRLALVLIENNEIIADFDEECFKSQSENLFVELQNLFNKTKFSPLDIDGIIITKGPGSYTGIRLAMTLAKVICQIEKKIKLFTISSLKLYANKKPNTLVVMDARANRVYCGVYDGEKVIKKDCVEKITDVKIDGHNLVGDLSLFGLDDFYYPIGQCFLNCLNLIEEVDYVAFVVPTYLKDNEAYK